MKILIIASGRCGSSQLQLALHRELNLPWCSEPFNPDLKPSEIPYQEGRVTLPQIRKPNGEGIVKICAQKYITFKQRDRIERWYNHYDPIPFYVKFAHEFDLVICLDRKDEGARILSALHALKHNTWYGKYKPQKLVLRVNSDQYAINDIIYQKTAVHEIARRLGQEVIYLEDLYEKDWKAFFPVDRAFAGISGLSDYFDPKARYCEV
jgi:hypothetical protein